jgi:hypothetical protein
MKSVLLIGLGIGIAAGGYGAYRALSAPSEQEYEPSASEVPLTADFEPAASKRVQPESYRNELTRIERELIQLERSAY